MISDSIRAVILGVVEGVTEFLPVSSTGHLLLAERFFDLGEDNFWKSFAVLIQLGAILAIVAIYFGKLWRIARGMFSNPEDRRFVIGVLVAFLPAAVIGAAAGGLIKGYLFNPWGVCFSLIVGGAILLWVDQLDLEPHEHDATTFPLSMYLKIGFAQCLAMIPGVSRSGASIVAAMLLGQRTARRVGTAGCTCRLRSDHRRAAATAYAVGPHARHGLEQRARVGMGAVREQMLGASLLDDAAEIHHRDLVAEIFDDGKIMADQDVTQAELIPEVAKEIEHLRLHRHIES